MAVDHEIFMMRLVMLIATAAAGVRAPAPPPRRVLLIGDSISMGYNFPAGRPTPCSPARKCQTGKIECGCQPDNRLGYGLYVQQLLAAGNSSAPAVEVEHSGGWYAGGQAGDSSNGGKSGNGETPWRRKSSSSWSSSSYYRS